MNPMQMLGQLMKSGGNPQQMIMSMLQQRMSNNPMAQSMFSMMQNNDQRGIENMARNMCKENGISVEQAINNAKQFFGM